MAFRDYSKPFDLVSTAAVLESLEVHEIPETYITLQEHIYKGCTGSTILHKPSNKYSIRNGVRQRMLSRENYSQLNWRGYSGGLIGKVVKYR